MSLIRSVARSIGVSESSIRQPRHRGRQSESSVSLFGCLGFFLFFFHPFFLIKIRADAHSRAHAGVLGCLLSQRGASVTRTAVALSHPGAGTAPSPPRYSFLTLAGAESRVKCGFLSEPFVSRNDAPPIREVDLTVKQDLCAWGQQPLTTKPMTE